MSGQACTKMLAGVAGFLLVGSAQALPGADFELGARYWRASPDGHFASKGRNLDAQGDLGFEREGTPTAYAWLGLPIVAFDAEYTRLDYSGSTQGQSFQVGNRTFTTLGRPTDFEADLLHGGALFRVPLPFLDLGMGAGPTHFDGEATVGSERRSGAITLPVAKAEARLDFPGLPRNATLRGDGLGFEATATTT